MNDKWLPYIYGIDDTIKDWNKPTCECGSTIALGRDDHDSFHADYCPVTKAYKEKLAREKK